MTQDAILSTGPSGPASRGQHSGESLKGLRRKEAIAGYTFLIPNLIGFLTFSVFPILATLYFAFTNWDLATPPAFSGLENIFNMFEDEL